MLDKFKPPVRFTIYTDGNELELVNLHPRSKMVTYKYVKSHTKLGMLLVMKQSELEKFLNTNEIFKP